MPENLYDIAVIGGGASGLIAALSAAKCAPGLHIAVLERQSRVGKKLMATGNGRCNLTNMRACEDNYHGSASFIRPAMNRFPPAKVLSFFETLGVHAREEDDGRVYPMSDQASSVVDALRLSMEECGIEELCDFDTAALTRAKDGYRLTAVDGRQLIARRVICSAGGAASPSLGGSASGYRLLESCGHELTPRFPALVQLKANPEYTRPLKGIRYSGGIDLLVNGQVHRTETGEILFTEYGLSGIAVMQVSRIAAQEFIRKRPQTVEARLHLLPMSCEEAFRLLVRRREGLSSRALENFLTGLVNKRIGQMLIKWTSGRSLSDKAGDLSDQELSALASALTGWTLEITGTQGLEQAQVTAGGVRTQDVDPHTMESLLADGLYLTGEILDVDGDCGGFNLQWAWASGLTAGESCARSLVTPSGAQTSAADRPARPLQRPSLPRSPHASDPERRTASHSAPAAPAREQKNRPERTSSAHRDHRRPDGASHSAGHPSSPSFARKKTTQPSKGMKKPHD